MRTLGIDLAAQDAKTACCAVHLSASESSATVESLAVGVSEDELLEQMRSADAVGIDAPFGWPVAMMDALREWREDGRWPVDGSRSGPDWSRALRFRATDLAVQQAVGIWPLSVSSDKIAHVAWRAAGLLSRHAEGMGENVDRTGAATGVFEVYPGAALAAWGLAHRGYKGRGGADARKKAGEAREALLGQMEAAGSGWLRLGPTPDARAAMVASDDAFDAFLAALAAAAAAKGLTARPSAEQEEHARVEGWIHVPKPDSFGRLAS